MGYKTKIQETLANLSKKFVDRGAPDPRTILKACIKTMEQGRKNLLEKTYVPNLYRVYLRGKDIAEMGPLMDSIRKELTSHLAGEIRNRKYATTTAGIVVDLVEYPEVGRAGFRVEGIFTDDAPAAGAEATVEQSTQGPSAGAPTSAPTGNGPTVPAAPPAPLAPTEPAARTKILEDDEGATRILQSPAAVFEAIAGGEKGRVIKLEVGSHTLGRGRDATVRFEDPEEYLSRIHATIEVTPEGVQMVDSDSANGTFVNDRRVQRTTLGQGDVVRLGKTELKYHGPVGPAPSSEH